MSNLILQQMRSFSLHYSTDCNMNCKYCYIDQDNKLHTEENKKIREAILNGTFIKNIIDLYQQVPEQKMNIESYSLWGAEPTINGDLFYLVHAPLLDFFPNIVFFDFSTNGLVGGKFIYKNFVIPMLEYAETHKRKLTFQIQFSLDGPPELQDKYRGEGSNQKCLNTINYIYNNFDFSNKYLRLRLSTKSTLNGYEIEHYSPERWCQYMDALAVNYAEKDKDYTISYIGQTIATFEVPGNYTVEQGRALIDWKKYVKINTEHFHSCCAGQDSKTIDYLGNIYDCHLLANKNISQEELRQQFETTMNTLVASNEAIEQDRDKLFNAISSVYCWGATNKNLDSYIRLLGNGFLL